MRDRVHGIGFSYDCKIGFHEYERHIRQRVVIDFEAETDWREAARADKAKDLVDYYHANLAIQGLVAAKEYRLIEALAEDVARVLLANFPIDRVRVKVMRADLETTKIDFKLVEASPPAAMTARADKAGTKKVIKKSSKKNAKRGH